MDWNTLPLTLAALAMPLAAAPAAAQDSVERLAPTAGWTLNYDDDSCALARTFGDESAPTLLELRQYAPDFAFVATIASQRSMLRRFEPQVRFAPQESETNGAWAPRSLELGGGYNGVRLNLTSGASREAVSFLAVEDESRNAHEGAVEELRVTSVFSEDFSLQTGEMHGPLSALRDCMAELLTHWGLDGEAHRTLSRRAATAEGNNWTRAAARSIPRWMLRTRGQNYPDVLIMVDAQGQPTSCRSLIPSNADEYTELICEEAMDSAQFAPALDADENPVASFFIYRRVTLRPGGS